MKSKIEKFTIAVVLSTLLMCFTSAAAQVPVPDLTRQANEKTRQRRASPGAADTNAPPVSRDAAEKGQTPPDVNLESEAQVDPITSLRDQIEMAASAQERKRLVFALVDQLLLQGKKEDAINELHQMTAEDRFDPQSFYNIGNALARLSDAEGAIAAYRKAIDQRKGGYSRAQNNLGVVLMREGRWDEAYDALLTALKLENFRYAEASYNLGRLHATRGENDLALREWRRTLTIDPQHAAAAQAITSLRNADGIVVGSPDSDNKKADAVESRKVDAPRTATTAVQDSASASTFHKPLTVDPVTFNLLQRARNAREHGKIQEAVAGYRNVIQRMHGYFGPANLELSYSLITLKQNDAALANLQQVVSRDGETYPISYYHLARLYEIKGELKLAEESYGQAAKLYEKNSQFMLDVSRVREKRGDYRGALAAMQSYLAVLQQKPDWAEMRMASLRQKIESQHR